MVWPAGQSRQLPNGGVRIVGAGIAGDADRYGAVLTAGVDARPCPHEEGGRAREVQTYRTKHELALDLIERALRNGVEFSWLGFDGFYGSNGQLLRMINGAGVTFMADGHRDQWVWTADPTASTEASPMRVETWVEAQPRSAWKRITVRNGTKGPMELEVLHAQVWLYQDGDDDAHR